MIGLIYRLLSSSINLFLKILCVIHLANKKPMKKLGVKTIVEANIPKVKEVLGVIRPF